MNRSAAFATVLALVGFATAKLARADDPPAAPAGPAYITVDELVKKRGTMPAAIVVIGKEDSDEAKTVLKLAADPKLAKAVKDGLPLCRIDTQDEHNSKILGIPVAKEPCVYAFDGYVVAVKQHTKALTADTIHSLAKAGADSTKQKKATEKNMDKAETKAEDLAKKGDTGTACQQLLAIIANKAQIPCDAVDRAEKKIEELKGLGMKVCTEAKAATDKKDFSTAHKKLSEAQNNYPIPEVLDEVKSISSQLASAERAATGK